MRRSILHGGRLFCWHNSKTAWDMIIDAVVVAAISGLATLGTGDLPDLRAAYVACYAFAVTFFAQVALERGIKPSLKPEKDPNV